MLMEGTMNIFIEDEMDFLVVKIIIVSANSKKYRTSIYHLLRNQNIDKTLSLMPGKIRLTIV